MKVFWLVALIVFATNVYAWDCPTHTWICQQAGYGDLNCCRADQERVPPMVFHHCADNSSNCSARVKAREFLVQNQSDIAAHLFADALSPPHWFSRIGSCHSKLESRVGRLIDSDTNWSISILCDDGTIVNASREYMDGVVIQVKDNMETNKNEEKEQQTDGFWGLCFISMFVFLAIIVGGLSK